MLPIIWQTEAVTPFDLKSDVVLTTLKSYKDGFISEITKLNVNLDEIEMVSIEILYKPGVAYDGYISVVFVC